MNDQQRSEFPIIRTGAAIGAVAGFSLQSATFIWAVMSTGGLPGPFEMIAVVVITLVVAGVGAAVGAFAGGVVKAVWAILKNR